MRKIESGSSLGSESRGLATHLKVIFTKGDDPPSQMHEQVGPVIFWTRGFSGWFPLDLPH